MGGYFEKTPEFQNTERKQRCFAESLRNTAAGNLNIRMSAHLRGEKEIFWPDIEIAIVYKDDFFAECNCPFDQCFLRRLIEAQDAKMDPVVNIDDAFRGNGRSIIDLRSEQLMFNAGDRYAVKAHLFLGVIQAKVGAFFAQIPINRGFFHICLLYTSPSPRDCS